MGKIITSVFVLVGIYLFLSNGDRTAKIITSISSSATSGIKTLQGR